ncbi:MAG TPA: serine/threonine-protein kinase [Bellilinea sp.]|nr:serine/threonine-protein kinase [Bellilinea sp.]
MTLDIIRLENLGKLRILNFGGAEGTIHLASDGKLVKIYNNNSPKEAAENDKRLRIIANNGGLYKNFAYFCAIPEAIIESAGVAIGFKMSHFQGFHPLGRLASKEFCVSNKITIRKVAMIFLKLHDFLSDIHQRGFVIGDFNPDNIMFKLVNKSVHFAFVDVDSWAISKGSTVLPLLSITPGLCHPELEKDRSRAKQYHDWYSFALLLARSLVKGDPFNLGVLDNSTMAAIRGERRIHGITCWDQRILLPRELAPYMQRFGKKLTDELVKWLKGKENGVFLKEVLEDFLDKLSMCYGSLGNKQCILEAHLSLVRCPRCGEKLSQPLPRAKHHKNTAQQYPLTQDQSLLDSLFKKMVK